MVSSRLLIALCLVAPAIAWSQEEPNRSAGEPLTLGEGEANLLALRIAPRVEAIRGLKFKRAVPVRVVNDAEAREHFSARVARFWPEKRILAEQTVYTQLGILPAGTDLLALLFDILEEQAGGYYDPESGALFILDDMPRATAPLLMAHELTHALDDQHFEIDALINGAKGGNDRETAVGAVIEGSGTLVMTSFLISESQQGRMTPGALQELQESEAGRAEKLKAAPQFIQRSLVGAYLLGQVFLLQGNASGLLGGIRAEDLDRAFRNPPESTEQILHPEKYWSKSTRDVPREIGLDDLSPVLGEEWSLQTSGVLGELIMAVVAGADPIDVTTAASGQWTNEAAAGWGGDLWHLYGDGARQVTLLVTLWDTGSDADEFAASVPAALKRVVFRDGDTIVLVAGDAGARASALAKRAFAAMRPARVSAAVSPAGRTR